MIRKTLLLLVTLLAVGRALWWWQEHASDPTKPLDPGVWLARAKEIRAHTEALSDREVAEVCWFLQYVAFLENMPPTEIDDLCGSLMDRLEREAPLDRATAAWIAVQADARQREMVRYYATRHLSLHYELYADLSAVQRVLFARSRDPRGLAGPAALLALRRMEVDGRLTPEDRARLGKICRGQAASPDTSEMVKMTALEILRAQGDEAALPIAREILAGKHEIAVQIVAIGVIGALGYAGDIGRLNEALKNQPAFQEVAALALAQLQARIPPNAENAKGTPVSPPR